MNFKKHGMLLLLLFACSSLALADDSDNPCIGPNALLSIVNRPSLLDSACVVPYKEALVELGYQYQRLYPGSGYQHNLPETVVRLGLPAQNEVEVLLPNYTHQTVYPKAGFDASAIGFKHSLSATAILQTTVESLFILPTGSYNFGSHGLGIILNAIADYSLTSQVSVTAMMGISTLSSPNAAGGTYYTSINPDVELSWSPNDKTSIYGEVAGQSKIGPGLGSGFIFDTGILYLLRNNITVDAEVGQRISGPVSGARYVGAGVAFGF